MPSHHERVCYILRSYVVEWMLRRLVAEFQNSSN
jgi:hypothetical protein